MFLVSYEKQQLFSLFPLGTNHPHEILCDGDMQMLLPVTCIVCGDEELKLVSSSPHISVTTWSADGVEIQGK
jgi:hypothetical protein